MFYLCDKFNLGNHKTENPLRVWVLLQWLMETLSNYNTVSDKAENAISSLSQSCRRY